jgi:uncharacterized protein (UPF0548 family)
MLLLTEPSEEQIRQFISSQDQETFSYPEIGASRHGNVGGYTTDHHRIKLGFGSGTYERAVAALGSWKHFELGWVRTVPPETPVTVGATMAVLARPFGVWSLNACRIVYVINDTDQETTVDQEHQVTRFGFAYGTLPDHAECGEERFTIEWHSSDDSVWYDILAFSRPNLLARLAYPLTRRLQKKFACDSLAAMLQEVGDGPLTN